MRWLWMSRYDHEQYVAHLQHCFDVTQQRYNELLDKYHALKLEGATVMPDPNEFIPQPQSVDETDEERALEELHG